MFACTFIYFIANTSAPYLSTFTEQMRLFIVCISYKTYKWRRISEDDAISSDIQTNFHIAVPKGWKKYLLSINGSLRMTPHFLRHTKNAPFRRHTWKQTRDARAHLSRWPRRKKTIHHSHLPQTVKLFASAKTSYKKRECLRDASR
jgi:hypothetical protein